MRNPIHTRFNYQRTDAGEYVLNSATLFGLCPHPIEVNLENMENYSHADIVCIAEQLLGESMEESPENRFCL